MLCGKLITLNSSFCNELYVVVYYEITAADKSMARQRAMQSQSLKQNIKKITLVLKKKKLQKHCV